MPGSMSPHRVLVIDDDDAIATSLAFVLRAKGYDVLTAGDGAAGLAQYCAHRPDIVISDIMMPDRLGIDTIGKIRRSSSDVLIIAMSGSIDATSVDLLDRACSVGADVCLQKPFELAELLDALEHVPPDRAPPPAGASRH